MPPSMIPSDGTEEDAQRKREAAFSHGLNYLNIHEDALRPILTDPLLKKLTDFVTGCIEAVEMAENFDAAGQLAPFARKPEASS